MSLNMANISNEVVQKLRVSLISKIDDLICQYNFVCNLEPD